MNSRLSGVLLSDVRRFAGEHQVQLSRVNLLVGPNSIGKSTFLGCVNALCRIACFKDLNDHESYFNEPPFEMGSFDNIARFKSQKFRIGLEMTRGPSRKFEINFSKRYDGVPQEFSLDWHLGKNTNNLIDKLKITRDSTGRRERWFFEGPDFTFSPYQAEFSYTQFSTWLSRHGLQGVLPFSGEPMRFLKRYSDSGGRDLVDFVKYVNFFRHRIQKQNFSHSIKAIDPFAIVPRRRYNSNPLPEISDSSFIKKLETFGSELGLFKKISIRREDADYEILVDVLGEWHNLKDVGYGITNLLPFLSALVTSEPETIFLLQQPEAHIHPSAQAQLVKTIARSEHSFIVETHSDHIIDWCRILVKEKAVHQSEVRIIYFEEDPNDQTATQLHQIVLDERANLNGQPLSYREFFTNEALRLLGRPG